jgi:hypothetical protein
MTSRYVAPPGVPPPPGPYVPPGGYAPQPQPTPPPRKRRLLITAWLAITALLATAALVIGIVAISRPPATSANSASSAAPSTAAPGRDTTAADRALCNAIAPLMTESDRSSHEFVDSAPDGSPERDAAIPKYRTETEDWARRTQAVLDGHSDAQGYLRRTLQRFIDDSKLYVANLRPGPAKTSATEAWADSLVAYGGPLAICYDLGVQW